MGKDEEDVEHMNTNNIVHTRFVEVWLSDED
jgi:hypothetical protein